MPFLGTMINFSAVLISGILGALIKRGVPKRVEQAIINAMGACVVIIVVDGALEPAPSVPTDSFLSAGLVKMLVVIISMGLGTLIGTLIDIDKWVTRFGDFLEKSWENLTRVVASPADSYLVPCFFALVRWRLTVLSPML